MRIVIMVLAVTLLAVALLAAACSSAQQEAAPATSLPTTTTSMVSEADTSSSTTTPTTTSTTTTTTEPPSTTVTTVWVDPPPTTSTTAPPPPNNRPPEVQITSPGNLSSHVAAFDPDSGSFLAVVSMSAEASDADGDELTIDWFSSLTGYLGTGEFITASLFTIHDSAQPFITAQVTDEHGASAESTIQVIVWVPSDT